MANLAGLFNNEDTQNWFAACLATKCCREGLLDLVATVGQCLQTQVIQNAIVSNSLPSGTTCVSCSTSVLGVIPCGTRGVCRYVNRQCNFHTNPQRRCPKNLCNAMVQEIKSCHRFNGPSWRNTHADQWTSNSFEILKCFMPVEGYIDKGSAAVTDFNGLINVVINCNLFENYFSSDLKQTTNVCTEARAVTRDLRHTADFKLDRVELNKVYDALLALLSDPKFMSTNQTAQDAFKKISELKANKLTITPIDINAVLDDIKDCRAEVIKQMTEDAAKAITRVTDEKVMDAEKRISHTTDEKVKDAEERISHTTDEKVKDAEERISHTTDEKVKDSEERISHTTDEKVMDAEKRISHTTDEKVKDAEERISHTTDVKVKDAEGKIAHTTDEKVKEAEEEISHVIYERVQEAEGKLSHRTNERVREAEGRIAHSTDEKLKEAEGKIHGETAMGVSRIQRVVEVEAAKFNELEERNRKRSLDEYSRLKKEFRDNLIPYYKEELCRVPVTPGKAQFDEELSKIFAQPKLSYNKKQAVGVQKSRKGAPVKNYKDIFYKDGKEMKNIYILGEAGMGKSTFCLHLTSVWCDIKRESGNNSAEGSDQAEAFVPSVNNNFQDNQTINRSNNSTANRESEEQTLRQLSEDDKGGYHGKGAVRGHQSLLTYYQILKMDESESDNENYYSSEYDPFSRQDMKYSFFDTEILTRFDFVFTVILRKAKQDTKLDNLIDQQVIQKVNRSEEHDDALIRRIMFAEKCLVIIDGLDEWPHSIPDRIYRENWTYITTTRPWKMADIKLQDSKVDVELSLKGITDWKYLIERVFVSLNRKHTQKTGTCVEKQPKEFVKAVRTSNLEQFLKVPVVLMQLISLWFSEGKLGSSSCEIYAGTLEMMMKRTILNKPNFLSELGQSEKELCLPKCFPRCKPQLCMNNISFILNLAKLAFYTLTQEDKSSSVVFDAEVVDQYLSDTERRVALDIGIVSECEVIPTQDDRSTFNFLHKTFQEFLCAVFIATRHSDERKRYIATLFSTFGKGVGKFEKFLNVSEIFTFVCGMNPDAGVDMSQTISENITKGVDGYNDFLYSLHDYRILIEKGFSEFANNGHERPPLYYQHVHIVQGDKENTIQKHLLDVNDGRLLSLCVGYVSVWEVVGLVNRNCNLEYVAIDVSLDNTLTYLEENEDIEDGEIHFPPSVRQVLLHAIKSSSVVIDMSACDRLEELKCYDVNVSHMYISPGNLSECTLLNMSESSVRDVLTALESGAPRLQTLTIVSCSCPDLPPQLDLTLTGLNKVQLDGVDIGDSEILFPPSVRQVLLHAIKSSSVVIDMSACDRLDKLECCDVNVSHMYISPGNLSECTLLNMSESSVVRDVLTALESGAPRLQTLTIVSYSCPDLPPQLDLTLTGLNKVQLDGVDIGDSEIHFPPSVRQVTLRTINSSSGVIDMSACDRLEELKCYDVNVSHMYISPGNLSECTLLNMSESSVRDVLTALASGAPRLQTLTIESCSCPDLPPQLDLTLTGLNKVQLDGVDIGDSEIHFPLSVRQVTLRTINSSSGVIDMSACDRLEELVCWDVNVSHMYINPGNLSECTLLNMSESSVRDVLTALTSGAPRLQTLTMRSCRCPDLPPKLDLTRTGLKKVMLNDVDIGDSEIHFPPSVRKVSLCAINSSSGVIDMSTCVRLEELKCSDVNVSHRYINPGNLTECTLDKMSESSVVRDVLTALESGAPSLQTLTIGSCICPDLPPKLDLTLTGLENVTLNNVDIGDSEIHFPPSVRLVRLRTIMPSSGVIDMSACGRLDKLECSHVNVSHMYISPGNLTECSLDDMSESSVRDVLTALASGAPRLQTLTMRSCSCRDLPPQLLPTLTRLEKVTLNNVDIGDGEIHFPPSVRQVTLHTIKSSSGVIDMSACDRLEELERSNVNVSHMYISPDNFSACTLDDMSESRRSYCTNIRCPQVTNTDYISNSFRKH